MSRQDYIVKDIGLADFGRKEIDLAEAEPGFFKCLRDQQVEHLEVRPRGDLGNDASERPMLFELAADSVRADDASSRTRAADHGGGGLVTARLDAEDRQRAAGGR